VAVDGLAKGRHVLVIQPPPLGTRRDSLAARADTIPFRL